MLCIAFKWAGVYPRRGGWSTIFAKSHTKAATSEPAPPAVAALDYAAEKTAGIEDCDSFAGIDDMTNEELIRGRRCLSRALNVTFSNCDRVAISLCGQRQLFFTSQRDHAGQGMIPTATITLQENCRVNYGEHAPANANDSNHAVGRSGQPRKRLRFGGCFNLIREDRKDFFTERERQKVVQLGAAGVAGAIWIVAYGGWVAGCHCSFRNATRDENTAGGSRSMFWASIVR